MIKVMTIVGTRPELIKMSRVVAELDKHTNHILVHTGQNYDYLLNKIFFEDLDIREPNIYLDVARDKPAETIARIIERSDSVLESETPDALLLYGDTNSCLAVLPAKRRKIPVFHMEAGNRCFDQRVPEELNRKIVDHLSDVNMVLTEHARRYLIGEGLRPENIIKTGSHMREVIDYYLPKARRSDVLKRLNITDGNYFLVSAHREENIDCDKNLNDLVHSINGIAEAYGCPIIFTCHPRTLKRLELIGLGCLDNLIQLHKPFSFTDYIRLQMGALCVVSDSGTITEEAALLNLPAITIRDSLERPEGMDAGTLIMCGLKRERVLDAVRIVISQHSAGRRQCRSVEDYESPNVSRQILRVVVSYVEGINKKTWGRC